MYTWLQNVCMLSVYVFGSFPDLLVSTFGISHSSAGGKINKARIYDKDSNSCWQSDLMGGGR